MPPGPLERSSERADRMTVATMPYLERQGTNLVSGAMAGQQFVQNIEESQRRDALAESRMAAEEGRRRQYDANIGMMHQEMDIRQRQIAIDTMQAEGEERVRLLNERIGTQELEYGKSFIVRPVGGDSDQYYVSGKGDKLDMVGGDDPRVIQGLRMQQMREGRYSSRGQQGPDMGDYQKMVEDANEELRTMTAEEKEANPDREAYLTRVRDEYEDARDQMAGMPGLRQSSQRVNAFDRFRKSVYGKPSGGIIEKIRDLLPAHGLRFDQERIEKWLNFWVDNEGEQKATYRLFNLLGKIENNDLEEAEGIFGQ